jgi:5-formyltetrahydrofolate cyclo-ligase
VSIADLKGRLRREMQERRRGVGPEKRERAGIALAERALASPELGTARSIALYLALPDEMPTDALLRALLAAGRPLLLPRAGAAEEGRLEFVPVGDLALLRRGLHGTLEPPAQLDSVPLAAADLVFVPGLAFDRRGARLGRGGGWYDRSLPSGADAPLIFGLGYDFQLVEQIPTEAHDRFVDAVVTESELWRPVHRRRELVSVPG